MNLRILSTDFSICKIKNLKDVNFEDEFVFIGKTDEEISLVCSENMSHRNILNATMDGKDLE